MIQIKCKCGEISIFGSDSLGKSVRCANCGGVHQMPTSLTKNVAEKEKRSETGEQKQKSHEEALQELEEALEKEARMGKLLPTTRVATDRKSTFLVSRPRQSLIAVSACFVLLITWGFLSILLPHLLRSDSGHKLLSHSIALFARKDREGVPTRQAVAKPEPQQSKTKEESSQEVLRRPKAALERKRRTLKLERKEPKQELPITCPACKGKGEVYVNLFGRRTWMEQMEPRMFSMPSGSYTYRPPDPRRECPLCEGKKKLLPNTSAYAMARQRRIKPHKCHLCDGRGLTFSFDGSSAGYVECKMCGGNRVTTYPTDYVLCEFCGGGGAYKSYVGFVTCWACQGRGITSNAMNELAKQSKRRYAPPPVEIFKIR